MANIKVSEMTEATSFDDGDYTMIVQANQNKKLPFEVISDIIDEKINNYNIARYHVGSIIVDTANINPNTYLGFGTWQYFGSGKTLIGVDEEDEDFQSAELTGGEKKHTLTVEEMPSHNHTINGAGNTSFAIGSSTNMANRDGSNPNTTSTAYTGGGQAHNILQPYITVYFWKRVA